MASNFHTEASRNTEAKGNDTLERDTLLMHASGRPGKIEVVPTKPLATQRDLSLAYSPGVAFPCLHIARDPSLAYDYTAKGNLVAVISNGTAVLGLGDLGALASKPVMEGKAVLFKRFADVDSIDLEVDTRDVDEFIAAVRYLGPSFGGINLEDIKAPECFIIEQRLRELMPIPVFHDDQHGTAIISAAGLINALDLTGRDISTVKVVVNGAGAAGIACIELAKAMGVRHENVVLCDTKGTIYQGRTEGMNQWKSAHAVPTKARTLAEALDGADVFYGLSVKGAVTPEMVAAMAAKPIIFAMANPDPEITPEEVKAVRSDAIVATGRSDYPNQINNVLGFPYIFRGALDVRASTINDAMKIAAARAIAALAREDVPDEVDAAYSGRRLRYGPDYIIPVPFDPRLIASIPPAVAKAAMDSGVARKPIIDMGAYKRELSARLDPASAGMQTITDVVKANPKRVVFAEGEEEKQIRAAVAFANAGLGHPILLGREDRIRETMKNIGLPAAESLDIINSRISPRTKAYTDMLYARLQRRGALYRDVQRLVNQERNIFGSLMVQSGDADAMVTGLTRNYWQAFEEIKKVIDPTPGELMFGMTVFVVKGKLVFVADTTVMETPTPQQLADIAVQTAHKARQMGHEPRVAMISYSNFGNPSSERSDRVREAVGLLDARKVDFVYDGEMAADVALDPELLSHFPFCRLKAPANVLVMPGLYSAHIASKLLQKLGGTSVIGPILVGLSKPVQITSMDASANDIVNMAVLASYDAVR
ncbi:NADP-dependent malic enzyme [Paramagnetospirillum magneticum]|uniref:NADP-dependent malic enzyme n=1 Tax=Paramagnetospirillum magneticum (strain ATCC 700264 / AMB-1) TaxID=342108 RepID=Q2WAN2_PARM1|nr:NADP-dependent malic enzyme [Paramagnetospirillum magneticum]BAE49093.1 NADP-dependent malic enzyme [Paramagnetospirillum magneticum AMB-1]